MLAGDEDPYADPELATRNTALNLTGASIRDSSYPGEPDDTGGTSLLLLCFPFQWLQLQLQQLCYALISGK
jgi:hypothetical protein